MRQELVELLQAREDLQTYIRQQPQWYRKLTRNPGEREAFETAALQFYKRTLPDQVAKFQNQLSMASIMIEMFQYMKQQNSGTQ